jgi:hypothetical protein
MSEEAAGSRQQAAGTEPKPELEVMTHQVIVTAVVRGEHVVLSRWEMEDEPKLKSKAQLSLAKALVLRLAKHLNREGGA